SKKTVGDPSNLWSKNKLRHGQINFIIPEYLQLDYYKEITEEDSCRSGNFIVLRNKVLNYTSDINILDHYVDELAEIVLSDRKSTRLNSSHVSISYAVFCLKKQKH